MSQVGKLNNCIQTYLSSIQQIVYRSFQIFVEFRNKHAIVNTHVSSVVKLICTHHVAIM